MSKKGIFSWLIISVFAASLFQGCKYDLGNASWETDILAPLATGNLGLRNIIPDSLLQNQPDGSLMFVYQKNLVGLPIDSLLRLPDTPVVNALSIPFVYTVPPGASFPVSIPTSTKFNLKDAQVTFVQMKSGLIKMKITNTLPTKVFVDYGIPKAKKDGVAFFTQQIVEANSTTEVEFDMSGYAFDMKGQNGNSYNTVNSTFAAKTDPNGPAVTLNANEFFLTITNTFFDLVPFYAKGYMGSQHTVIGPEESPVEPLSKLISGSLMTDSVKIGLEFRNGVGADVKFTLFKLEGRNAYTGNTVPLNHTIIGNPINITRAQDWTTGSNPSVYNYNINYGNSNLQQFIENLPGFFNYYVDVSLNPMGNISAGNDFIYYNSELAANLKVELPLNFNAGNIAMMDTLDFNSSGDFLKNFKGGKLKVYIENGFPLEAELQATLLDTFFQPLETLFGNGLIASAELGANKVVNKKVNSLVTLPIAANKAENVKQAKHIAIKMRFNSALPGELIKIYDDYRIKVNVVADITYEL